MPVLANNVHPPLHDLFVWLWVRVFGDSEIAVRLPSAIAGTLALLAQYKGAQRFFRRPVAVSSTVLLSLTYAGIFYSQEARSYSFLMLFAILSFYVFLSVLKTPNTTNRVWFVVMSALLMYTHYFGVLFVALQLAYWFVLRIARRGSWLEPVINGFVLLVLYTPWVGVVVSTLAEKGGGAFWIEPPSLLTFAHFLATATYLIDSSMLLTAVLVACFGAAFALPLLASGFRARLVREFHDLRAVSPVSIILFLVGGTVFVGLLVSLHTPVLTARNLLVTAPLLYVLAGYWISLSSWDEWKQSAYVLFVSIILLIVILPSYYEPHKHQFRESLDYALSELEAGGTLVFLGGDAFMKLYRYYLDRTDAGDVRVVVRDPGDPIGDVMLSDQLVILGAHTSFLTDADREALADAYTISTERRFMRATVSVYER
jgi:mannosyltransferase